MALPRPIGPDKWDKHQWKTGGKTPAATISAAILREITAKGNAARFKKTDRGLFASSGK
jgi:hypothetical protein